MSGAAGRCVNVNPNPAALPGYRIPRLAEQNRINPDLVPAQKGRGGGKGSRGRGGRRAQAEDPAPDAPPAGAAAEAPALPRDAGALAAPPAAVAPGGGGGGPPPAGAAPAADHGDRSDRGDDAGDAPPAADVPPSGAPVLAPLPPRCAPREEPIIEAEWAEINAVFEADDYSHWLAPCDVEGLMSSRRFLALNGGCTRCPQSGLRFRETAALLVRLAERGGLDPGYASAEGQQAAEEILRIM
eukprot:7379244-Prymnesium_polylepis.1